MTKMQVFWLSALLAPCALNAQAVPQDATTPKADARGSVAQAGVANVAQSELPGDYELGGVMETGSGLRLLPDGRFEWFFSYGALDLGARGTWTRHGDTVDLAVAEMGVPPQVPQARFERMTLRIDGRDLVPSWPWDMDGFAQGAERGRYRRVQP